MEPVRRPPVAVVLLHTIIGGRRTSTTATSTTATGGRRTRPAEDLLELNGSQNFITSLEGFAEEADQGSRVLNLGC